MASKNSVCLAIFKLMFILSYHSFHVVHPPTNVHFSVEVPLGSEAERWEGTDGLHENG